jgi:hypothetical protein
LNFLQVLADVNNFSLRTPQKLGMFVAIVDAFNFDLDVVGPQCWWKGWSSSSTFYLNMILPLIQIVISTMNCLANVHSLRGRDVQETKLKRPWCFSVYIYVAAMWNPVQFHDTGTVGSTGLTINGDLRNKISNVQCLVLNRRLHARILLDRTPVGWKLFQACVK